MREIYFQIQPGDGVFANTVPPYMRNLWGRNYDNAMTQSNDLVRYAPDGMIVPLQTKSNHGFEQRAIVADRYIKFTHHDTPTTSVYLPFTVPDMRNLAHASGGTTSVGTGTNIVNTQERMAAVVETFSWVRSMSFTPLWRTPASLGLTHKMDGSDSVPLDEVIETPDRLLAGGTFRIVVDDDTEIEDVHLPDDNVHSQFIAHTDLLTVKLTGTYNPHWFNINEYTDSATTRVSDVVIGEYPLTSAFRVNVAPPEGVLHRFIQNGFFGEPGYGETLRSSNDTADTAGNMYWPAREINSVFETPGADGGENAKFRAAAPQDASSSAWLDQLMPQRYAVRMVVNDYSSAEAPYDTDAFTAGVTFALGSIGG